MGKTDVFVSICFAHYYLSMVKKESFADLYRTVR